MFWPNLETHQACLLFCFLPIIEKELKEFTRKWKSSFERHSSGAPAGKPDLLFEVLSTIGYCKQGVAVATDILGINQHPGYESKEMHQLLICYVQIQSLKPARHAESGINMYVIYIWM